MILDIQTLLSDDQDLAQIAGDYYSDVLNQYGDPGYTTSQDAPNGITQDLGKGYPTEFLCQITEDFASGGAATIQATLETATDEVFTSPVELVVGPTLALADMIAGAYLLPQHVPYGSLQWVRVKYTIATATTTAGKVTAGIVCGHQSNK